MNSDFENAVSVPAGLISCRLSGVQRHISAIAENALWLRNVSEEDCRGRLDVCFRRPDGSFHTIQIDDFHAGPAHCDFCGALVRLSFLQQDFVQEFRRAMAFYGQYIRAFSEDDVRSLCNCPPYPEDDFAQNFDFSFLRLPEDKEICISLHDPVLCGLYLNHNLADFLRIYSVEKQIPGIKQIHRLYIGSGFCRQLFPDPQTLERLLARAGEDGLSVTLVTAPDPGISDEILRSCSGEMLVNDWGLLHRLQNFPRITPVLGTLLNKRRKDPRMQYKPDLNPALLRQSSINSPEYLAFLKSLGVRRLEFERCGYGFDLPAARCSLHLPFYQTNTSVYCPLRALAEHGDRACQSEDEGCPRYCLTYSMSYPAFLKMLSRWNSLFALDDRPLDDLPGFDRIVLNL